MEAAQSVLPGQQRVQHDSIPDGFETIFVLHYQRVTGILIRLVGSRAQAEDLANEVFWKLSRQPVAGPLWGNVGGWLYRTATHAGIDALRAASRRTQYEAAAVAAQTQQAESPLDELLRLEESGRVRRVLARMKPAQAQLLLMRASGSSYKEIADALEVAVSGVGTLLTRAETDFRKRYTRLVGRKETI